MKLSRLVTAVYCISTVYICLCDAFDFSCQLLFSYKGITNDLIKKEQFNAYKTESGINATTSWLFETNVTWTTPVATQPGHSIDRYLLEIQRVPLSNTLPTVYGNCGIEVTDDDIITNNTWYIFENLAYKELYSFRVYFIELGTSTRGQPSVQKIIHTEDCFKLTRDGEFCTKQGVRLSGEILDLRVENITINRDMETVTAFVSWIPPVHVAENGSLSRYIYSYSGKIHKVTSSSFVEAGKTSHWSHRQTLNISNLLLDETYTFYPIVVIEGQDYLTSDTKTQMQFNASPDVGIWTEWSYSSMCELPCEGVQSRARECYPMYANCSGEGSDITNCYNASECTTRQEIPESRSVMTYVLTVIPGLLFLSFTSLSYCLYKRKEKHGVKEALEEIRFSSLDPVFKDFEIKSKEFIFWGEKKKIGSGRFGSVYSCEVYGLVKENQYSTAAIKTPLETSNAAERVAFKKEIELMIQIGKHRHIVELLGCHTTMDPILMVMELMPNGSLLDVLRKCEQSTNSGLYKHEVYNLCEDNLYSFGRQVACGMEYISSQKVVHGDLAARNILVGVDNLVKISDFGLSQDTYEKSYVRLSDGEMPVKWYSLETITENLMTVKSDVWSFGILLYEIFTYGKSPYPGIVVQTLPSLLQSGYRMQRPEHCPYPAYELMTHCWTECPTKRPSFTELLKELDSIIEARVGYTYLKLAKTTSTDVKDESENCKHQDIDEVSSDSGNVEQTVPEDYLPFYNEGFQLDDLDPDDIARCLRKCNTELISNCDIEFVPRLEDSETGSTAVSEAHSSSVISSVDSSFLARCLVSSNTKLTNENKVTLVPIFEDS
ncbi:receptor tyrosine-protein kinase erbB-2-like isoform X2 [Anneissia japonica]|uniref:receptor tyrosine-protein kinase erbB-2-like isoform X2 n=1 Tax=Anneissia japonica TaxID=1529436 RepID=UPI0014259315|nr:receptor tyrosine-protein kinase erbB-2-like isoform X2 [Anneissia japonica]